MLTYDLNGNILTLTRTDGTGAGSGSDSSSGSGSGSGDGGDKGSSTSGNGTSDTGDTPAVDNLKYTYTGNRLSTLDHNNASGSVAEAGKFGYSYDKNGNMISDARKNLFLQYNYLNLLQKAAYYEDTPDGDSRLIQSANYTYLADGTKASVVDKDGNGYSYLGSLTYKRSSDGSLKLESATHGSGRIVVKEDESGQQTYENQYFITDHLGSVRVVFNQKGEVLARNDYYPFGKQHDNPALTAATTSGASGTSETPGTSTNPADNRYLYNSKEKQVTGNLNFLDYGWRMYNPEIGRWLGIDKLAVLYNSLSPYAFSLNNPMRFIDRNGLFAEQSESDEEKPCNDTPIDIGTMILMGYRSIDYDGSSSGGWSYENNWRDRFGAGDDHKDLGDGLGEDSPRGYGANNRDKVDEIVEIYKINHDLITALSGVMSALTEISDKTGIASALRKFANEVEYYESRRNEMYDSMISIVKSIKDISGDGISKTQILLIQGALATNIMLLHADNAFLALRLWSLDKGVYNSVIRPETIHHGFGGAGAGGRF